MNDFGKNCILYMLLIVVMSGAMYMANPVVGEIWAGFSGFVAVVITLILTYLFFGDDNGDNEI